MQMRIAARVMVALMMVAVALMLIGGDVYASLNVDLWWAQNPSVFAKGDALQDLTIQVYNEGSAGEAIGTIVVEVPSDMKVIGATASREDGTPIGVTFSQEARGVSVTSSEIVTPGEVVSVLLAAQAKVTAPDGFAYFRLSRLEGDRDIMNNIHEVYIYERGVTPCYLSLDSVERGVRVASQAETALAFDVSKGQYTSPGVGEAEIYIRATKPITTMMERSSNGIAEVSRSPGGSLIELEDLMGLPPQASIGAVVSTTTPNIIWADIVDRSRVEIDSSDNHLTWFVGGPEPDLMVGGRSLSNKAVDGRTRLSLVTGVSNLSGTITTTINSDCSWEIERGEIGAREVEAGDSVELVVILTMSPCRFEFYAYGAEESDLTNNSYLALTPKIFLPLILR